MLNARQRLTALSLQNDTETIGRGARSLYQSPKIQSERPAWTDTVVSNNTSVDGHDNSDVQDYPMRARTPIDDIVSLCTR